MPRGKYVYDYDDEDDGYDDDDYDDYEEEEYYEQQQPQHDQEQSKTGHQVKSVAGQQQPVPNRQQQTSLPTHVAGSKDREADHLSRLNLGSSSSAAASSEAFVGHDEVRVLGSEDTARISGPSDSETFRVLGSGTAASAAAPRVWRCPACTFDNPAQFLACDVCLTERPAAQGGGAETAHERGAVPPRQPTLQQMPQPTPQASSLLSSQSSSSSQPTSQPSSLARALSSRPQQPKQKASEVLDRFLSGDLRPEDYVPHCGVVQRDEDGGPGVAAFDFAQPSPDDSVLASLARGIQPTAGVKPRKSHGDKVQQQQVKEEEKKKKTKTKASEASAVVDGERGGRGPAERGDGREGGEMSEEEASHEAEKDKAGGWRELTEYEAEAWVAAEVEKRRGGKVPLHLVVLGHVDAGKSTLTGHLLQNLGLLSKKDVHRNSKEAAEKGKASFSFAFALDESEGERQRGVTVAVGLAQFETSRFLVTVLDAPGHRDFIPNMISGAAQADAALLVIDATPGAFEAGLGAGAGGGAGPSFSLGSLAGTGQTKEHAQLARSLGVEQLIVVVNKLDVVGYEEGVFEGIKQKLGPLLKSCGFKDKNVLWMPVSAFSGQNLDSAATDPVLSSWWSGGSLLEAVDSLQPPSASSSNLVKLPLRLPVAEVLKGSRSLGQAAVSGKLESGSLRLGSKVLVMPGQHIGTVKSLERFGTAVDSALAGESVDVGLSGIDSGALATGCTICHPEFPIRSVEGFEARVLTLDLRIPLLRGSQVIVHAHATKESGHLSELVALLDPKTGAALKSRPRAILSNQTALVKVLLDRPMCLEEFSSLRALGRVALRGSGQTYALGIIIKL